MYINTSAPTDYSNDHHYAYYDSFESQSPRDSVDSPYGSISEKSKKMRKKRNTYMKIEDDARIKLLEAVQQGETLKAAARRYNINYSSAKSILHTFRKEGRILKKSAQERTARKRTKNSSDLEMSPIYLNKHYQDDEDINGIPENSTYQTYHSPETTYKSGQSPSYGSDEEGPKVSTRPFTINSFGGFLRVDAQGPPKPDQMNLKNPASTIVLKLDSQKGTSEAGISNMQGRNWQLNVNVHNETVKTTTAPEPLRLDESHHDLKISQKLKSFENFYMNYTTSSANQVRRDQSNSDSKLFFKDFDGFTDMLACADETAPTEPHNFDVSCFLSSSPSYNFFKRTSEVTPFVGLDHYSAMDNQQQHPFYDSYQRAPYPESGKSMIEQTNTTTIKTAGL